jgi:biotin carboxyl carrier protein
MQVRIGDEAFDVERDGTTWRVDGRAVEVHAAPVGPKAVHLLADGRSRVVTVEPLGDGRFRATVGGRVVEGVVKDARALLMEKYGLDAGPKAAERVVKAPMPGLVVRVLVAPGDAVEAGQGVVVLEAMKMENELKAPAAGTVTAVHAQPGAAVGKGALLLEIGD